MGHIQRHHLSDAKVVVPHGRVLTSADAVLGPSIEQLVIRGIESRTLAALQDALLPALVSGELRIPDAERIVGRCA
jgi:type I restriction enzyme S subunit